MTFQATANGGKTPYNRYTFRPGDGAETTQTSPAVTYAYKLSGSFSAKVIVFDAAGAQQVSNFVTITVATPPTPPPVAPTTGSIQGVVRSSQGSAPIAGAQVVWGVNLAGAIGTTTDANGNYRLNNVPAGTKEVTVSKSGYTAASWNIAVPAGGVVTANFTLNPTVVPPPVPPSPTTGNIQGVVRSLPNNVPLAGATVSVGGALAATDASGGFRISGFHPASYVVTASKSGYI